MENIGKPKYTVVRNGVFGVKISCGIVTGVRFTEDAPLYEVSFGKDKWWTFEIFDSLQDVCSSIGLPSLERVVQTHDLKIKYK